MIPPGSLLDRDVGQTFPGIRFLLFVFVENKEQNWLSLTLRIKRNIGKSALEPVGAARLSAWLAQCETENRIVIYQSDHWLSLWTKRCLRQADCILLVGMGDRCPTRREEAVLSDIDEYITSSMTSFRARKDLVLLHRADTVVPEHTEEWLDFHDWCFLHHHIRCPDRMFFRKRARNFHTGYLAAIPSSANDKHNDFSRLARILTGTSVGVVLGGGGARGFAHVGMLEALVEHDIPIDMIAGVSMGAYVSALWASRRDIKEVRKMGKFWAEYVLVPWRVALEITYPYIAIFRGRWWNDPVKHSFGDMQIENLWIPYFCSTTDVTDLKPRTHYRGTLWRYVRASMTIAGFIPPMCDPEDGHLLIDGGYSDNLPAVVLKERGAGTIIAIDVSAESEKMTFSYGDEFSGWTGLKQQFWPWGTSFALPNIVELFTRYMRPPIGSFGTMEFKSYDEIVDVGYYYGLMTFVDDGVVRSTLAEMEKQLLTTSFGLYVPNTALLPVLGQYLTDLASYVTVQEDHRDSEEKDYRDSDEMFISNIQLTELKSVDSPPANAAAAEKPEDEDASPQLLHPIGPHESLDELWRHTLSEPDLTPVKLAESFWAYSL